MKKLLSVLLLYCLTAALCPGPSARAEGLRPVSTFEGGALHRAGRINVVVMKGNFHQMGRQYGALLARELQEFYSLAAEQIGLGTPRAPYGEVLARLRADLAGHPFYVREWVRGMGETSGLGAEKQTIAALALVPIVLGGGCSGLLAWGEYTRDGATVAGRNWDLGTKALLPYQKFLTVAVFNPSGSGQGVADINYLGQITWQTAMNRSGLFYDLQNGSMSDPAAAKNRLNSNSALMSLMLDATSWTQVDAFFDAVRAESGLIINAADARQGASYEWGTFDYRRRVDDEKGLVAAANHFLHPTWPAATAIPEGKAAAFTRERYANLLALGKKAKGRIDAPAMRAFFDAEIPRGGPSFPEESGLVTYYSLVAAPQTLKLWLKVRDLQGWTAIDLKPLFEVE